MSAHRSYRLLRPFAALAIAAAVWAWPSPAAADHPLTESGLRVVRPSVGPPLLTHGPDPRPPKTARAIARREFGAGVGLRPPACTTSAHVHVLYAHLEGTTNRLGRSRATIRESMARTNAVLNAESLASGGATADLRVRCDPDNQITVDSLVTRGASFADVVSAARAAGYRSPTAKYMIFFDGQAGSTCGTASTWDDDRLSSSNIANTGGGYGIAYAGCWTEETPLHEIAHLMGAVQASAPHSTGTGGHCYEENDVLCYSPDGGNLNQGGTVTHCAGDPRFDCNFDDYFDAAPEPGEYLSSHWNVGSPLNAFIAFGGGSPGGGFGDTVSGLIEGLLGAGRTNASASGAAAAPGEWKLHRIKMSGRSEALTVRIRNAQSDDLTLYLRSRQAPQQDRFACSARVRNGRAVCKINRPRGGVWIAGVLSGAGGGGATYEITAKLRRR